MKLAVFVTITITQTILCNFLTFLLARWQHIWQLYCECKQIYTMKTTQN